MKLPILACAALLAATPARADFLLAPSSGAAAATGHAIPPPPVTLPRRGPPTPQAEGFGEGVPLHVAARQIAPAGIAVVFAEGTDGEAPVTWRGGRAWNLVLADAVRPLGLRIYRTPGQVRIGR